ncbi:glycosyltransferase [Knoellia sp. CPCC 206450]|uniref:glycosyltransferase n=1 Tax=Knoellia tibetensis TaxID=3404798 RepID=UPI003B432344
MRIAVVATSRHPISEPYAGGQETHTALLVRGLRSLGHFVRLYAVDGTDIDLADELVPYVGRPRLSDLARQDPSMPEIGFLSDLTSFTGAVADLLARDDVDLVHNQSLHFLPLALSTALRVPLVTTLHTPPYPWMELGIALAPPRAEFVSVSVANASGWTTLTAPPRVILNGVEDDGLGEGTGGDDLVWVGRLTAEKGTDLAIAAARRAGRRLRIVGPVSNRAWFDEVVAPELGDDVVHVGHLSHRELVAQVRECAVALVTPRWDEPFGLVAAEAAVSGTPVVALDRGGLREFLAPSLGVLVDPEGSDEEVAARLAVAVDEAVSRRDVRQSALAALGSERMVAEHIELYRELVLSRRATS